jgi:Novel STAND NTPase 1
MRNPYVGLRPFRTSDSDIFFGRDREIAVLGNLVRTLPVLIIYAPSGTGKSSVVNAGLAPSLKLDPTLLVVIVSDPREDILLRTSKFLAANGWISKSANRNRNLASILQEHFQDTSRRVVIVVDKFEERLTQTAELDILYAQVARLANLRTDAATIVFSLREDYLGELEPLMRRVSGLLDASYRIPFLSRSALEKAVYGPLAKVGEGVTPERGLVDRVLTDLERQPDRTQLSDGRFEAGYFQIVWSRLWKEDVHRPGDRLTHDTYERLGGVNSILESFVTKLLSQLIPLEAETLAAMIRYLVLPTGSKIALTVDDLVGLIRKDDLTRRGYFLYGMSSDQLDLAMLRAQVEAVFERLIRSEAPLFRRVIRSEREEFELVHDLLGKTLLKWRIEYERDELSFYQESGLTETSMESNERSAAKPDAAVVLKSWTERLKKLPDPLSPADICGQELSELRDATPDIFRSIEVLFDTRRSTHIRSFMTQVQRLLPHMVSLMINHPSRTDRGLLQEISIAFNFNNSFAAYYAPSRPSGAIRYVRGAGFFALALIVASGGALVSDLLLRDALTRLGIEYKVLTLAFPVFIGAMLYLAVAEDSDNLFESESWWRGSASVLISSTGLRSIGHIRSLSEGAPKLQRILFWFIRVLAIVPTWWPFHFFLIVAAGYVGGLVFNAFGWAATAGFNVAVLFSSLGVGIWYFIVQEDL